MTDWRTRWSPERREWRRRGEQHPCHVRHGQEHEAAFFPLALAAMAVVGDPRVHLFVVVAAMLCLLPAILNARVEPAPILALLGTAPILVPPGTVYSRSDSWSLIISVVISALMVCVAEGIGDRVARSSAVPAPYAVPSRVQPRVQALRVLWRQSPLT